MYSVKSILLFGLLFQSGLTQAYRWPSPQYDALEMFLYEGQRGDDSNLASLVHPCRKRTGTLSSVPAEWLRLAFHDMATHNVNDGTGGMDGSIVYELQRPENFGLGFNQSVSDFETFPNKYVSRADIFALGAVFSVATCGGPIIPFRGGRVDTWSPGAFGTPEPHHDLETLTRSFANQGFSSSEMIGLVACGHTMGGVRNTNFPQLVQPGPDPSVPHIVDFDTTPQFDSKVVTEYLDGTTQNVLVVTPNTTMASDLRVFTSDGNQTMRGLADPNQFNNQCQSLLERMINTVPSGVTLTDEITLLPAKVWGVQLTIERNQLLFKSNLRLLQEINGTLNRNRTVTMFWCDKYGNSRDCNGSSKTALPAKVVQDDPNNSPITQQMGYYMVHYKFVAPLDPATSISRFWFEVDEHDGSSPRVYNNEGDFYVVPQDQVIFVPTLSSVLYRSNGSYTKTYTNRNGESFTAVFNLTVGVREGSNPSRVYVSAFDSAVRGFPYPVNTTVDFTKNTSMPAVAGYELYTGSVEDSGMQLTVDLHADIDGQTYTDDFRQTTFLDNTPYIEPTVVNTSSRSSPSSASSLLASRHVIGGVSLSLLLGLLSTCVL